jgi:hypothetical protein
MIFRRILPLIAWIAFTGAVISTPRSSTDALMRYAVTDPPFPSLTYGIQAFMWWGDWWATVHSQWIQTMAFTHVKHTFAWDDLEPIQGQWNFTQSDVLLDLMDERGLRVVARLSDAPEWSHPNIEGEKDTDYIDAPPDDFALWATYCRTVAERYRGRIGAYQIWNEPNLSREWGNREPNAAGYVALLQVCSDAIRAVDPDAILISAGLAPTGTYDATAHPDDIYLQGLYDAGFEQYVDVVGMHAPGYSAPELSPDEAQQNGSQRFFTFRRVEDLRKIMVANGDAARQVALLEVGWTTDPSNPNYAWFAVDEETQAQYLVEAYQYAADHWRPWVGLMSTIYISNPTWTTDDEEYWWSVTTPDGRTRPAYVALANMAKYCDIHRVLPARAPDSPEALGLAPTVNCLS